MNTSDTIVLCAGLKLHMFHLMGTQDTNNSQCSKPEIQCPHVHIAVCCGSWGIVWLGHLSRNISFFYSIQTSQNKMISTFPTHSGLCASSFIYEDLTPGPHCNLPSALAQMPGFSVSQGPRALTWMMYNVHMPFLGWKAHGMLLLPPKATDS